jgi:prepilin-type N-terminal cleavage/methylation domain-containing protein
MTTNKMLKIFNKTKKIKQKKNQQGFTLLETLVAIFILTLSITGPVYISSVAFKNTIESRDNISAQYLAEEVVEVIKNIRDKNALTGNTADFLASFGNLYTIDCFNDFGLSEDKCIMKKNINENNIYNFEKCNGQCPNLSFNPEGPNVVYGAEGVLTTSKFIREFYFETLGSNPGEVRLVVIVKWDDKGKIKTYTLNERLYNIDYKSFFKR